MKLNFSELGHQQTLDDETLAWTCDCAHGSIGRFRKDRKSPCIHVWNIIFKVAKAKIAERMKERYEEIDK